MQSLPTLSLLARWSTNWSDRLPAALLLLMALCASTAQAACVRDEPGRLWNYIGTLAGKHPVRMVLVFSGTQVQGVYTYASSLRYPITVSVHGKRQRVADAAALIPVYEAVFTQAYRDALLADIPRHLFVRDQGAMLGNGAAWIGANGKVIAINN